MREDNDCFCGGCGATSDVRIGDRPGVASATPIYKSSLGEPSVQKDKNQMVKLVSALPAGSRLARPRTILMTCLTQNTNLSCFTKFSLKLSPKFSFKFSFKFSPEFSLKCSLKFSLGFQTAPGRRASASMGRHIEKAGKGMGSVVGSWRRAQLPRRGRGKQLRQPCAGLGPTTLVKRTAPCRIRNMRFETGHRHYNGDTVTMSLVWVSNGPHPTSPYTS